MFNHRYRYAFIMLLSFYAFLNTVLCDVYHYFRIDVEWYYSLLTITGVTFLTWEGNRLLNSFFKKKFYTSKNKIRFLAIFFLAGNVVAFAAAVLMVFLVGNVIYGYNWSQMVNPYKLNIIYSTLINLFLHLLHAIHFFFREYKRQWSEAEELRRTNAQAQLQLVRNQINPHFLFNNLNVLSGMVIKDNPDANKFVEEFSKVYRYILNNQEKELVEVRSELEFIHPYLFLLNKRFDQALKVDINIPDRYKTWHVVPAALQMLIENAIKHNIVSSRRPLHIEIHANGNQSLVVKNNLQLKSSVETSNKKGLAQFSTLYRYLSAKPVRVDTTEKEFFVKIPLV